MNDRRNSFFRLFLLILLCLGVQSLRAQTVTKVFKNEPLKAVLKEVERQTKCTPLSIKRTRLMKTRR